MDTEEAILRGLRENPGDLYYRNRGHYLASTFDHFLWKYPLGAGMGRLGMITSMK